LFADGDFRDRTDFGVAEFDRGDVQPGAVRRDASFLAATFYAPNRRPGEDEQEAAAFDGVVSTGNLDFTFAESPGPHRDLAGKRWLHRRRDAASVAIFDDAVCGRLHLPEDGVRGRTEVQRTALDDPDPGRGSGPTVHETERIGNIDDRQDVRSDIEESAKARGELGVANDAHFNLLTLRSRDSPFLLHVLDFVFYKNIAGYFVRPFRPLLILIALATFFGVVRYVRQPTSDGQRAESPSPSNHIRAAQEHAASFLTCILDTFALQLSGQRCRSH
jgi:hypothetical protein